MSTQVIEGRRATVQTVDYGLPPKMTDLLGQLAIVTLRRDIKPGGASQSCLVLREHRFTVIRVGRWIPRTGINAGQVLDVRISMCADCGAVQVRDISIDRIEAPVVQRGRVVGVERVSQDALRARSPKRRDHVIGSYSGARPGQRQYR